MRTNSQHMAGAKVSHLDGINVAESHVRTLSLVETGLLPLPSPCSHE